MALDDPFAQPLPEDLDPKLIEDPFADVEAKMQPGTKPNETVIQKNLPPAAPKEDMLQQPPAQQPQQQVKQPTPAPQQSQPRAQQPAAQQAPAPKATQAQQPAQQQDPYADLKMNRIQRGFAKYLFGSDVTRKAWDKGTIGVKRSMVNAYVDEQTQNILARAAQDPRLRKLPEKKRKEVLRNLYRRTKSRLKRELAPLVGALATEKNEALLDPTNWLNTTFRKKGLPIDTDDIVRRFQQHLTSDPKLLDKWRAESSTWHRQYVRTYRQKLEQDILSTVRQSPAFKKLSAKDRKAVLKAVRDNIKVNADMALTPLIGEYDIQNPEKVAQAVDPAKAEQEKVGNNLLKVGTGAVIEGAADLVASPGDFLAWLTNDPNMRDNAVSRVARDIAQYGSKLQQEGISDQTKIKMQQIQEAFENGQYGTAVSLLAEPDVAAVYGVQSLGYVLGAGGVGGGARLGAARALSAFSSAKVVGRALRSSRVATTTTAASIGGATGAQQGREAADRIMAMDTDKLRATPAWAAMAEKLRRNLEREATDEEIKLALANTAAARASVHGAAISTASTLLLGGFTEQAFGTLGGSIGRALFGQTKTGATSFTGGFARAAVREAASEAVEEGGQQLATNMAVRDVTGEGDIYKGVAGAALTGATLGAALGGVIGGVEGFKAGTTPPAGDQTQGQTQTTPPAGGGQTAAQANVSEEVANAEATLAQAKVEASVDTDPDIQEARDEAAAVNLEMERVAAKAAGKDGDALVGAILGSDVKGIDGVDVREALTRGPFRIPPGTVIEVGKKKRRIRPFYDDPLDQQFYAIDEESGEFVKVNRQTNRVMKINPDRMTKEYEMAKALHDTWASMHGEKPIHEMRTVEALQVPDVEEDATVQQEELTPDDTGVTPEPDAPSVQLDQDTGVAVEDQVRAYMHMLVKSGEPEAMALRSVVKTFGRKAVPKDILSTYQNVDPANLREYLEADNAPRATAEHVMRVQKALGEGIKAHVVASGADVPGMGLNIPVATFKVNGGKDTFTVINAGAIKQPGRARALLMAHEIARMALDKNMNENLFKAAQIAAAKFDAGFVNTRGTVMDPEQVAALKNPKSKTADAIISQFQDRLMAGEETAIKAMRKALEESGVNIPRYMPNIQLWRTLVEAGYIPSSPYAKTISAPFGSITPDEIIPPASSDPETEAHIQNAKRMADGDGSGGAGGGDANNAGGGGATIEPNIVLGGLFGKMLKFGDNMGKMSALQGMLESSETSPEIREAGYEFINAMRSLQAQINETNNLRASAMADIENSIEQLAKKLGDTVEGTRARLNHYLAALHAKERNRTLWAMLVPLGDKAAADQRQALVERIMRGEGGPDTMLEIERIVENGQPAILRKDAVYGGMTDADADAIINSAKAMGLDREFAPFVEKVQEMAKLIRRWREESGVYAGPAKHILDAYAWDYYVPLRDTPQKGDFDLDLEAQATSYMMRPVVAKKKHVAGGRINLNNVDVITNLELELRDAAFAAAVARPVKAAAKFVNAGDWSIRIGKTREIGELKYHTGDENRAPGWEIPEVATNNPRNFSYFDEKDGKWHRLTMFDGETAQFMRRSYDTDLFKDRKIQKLVDSVGNVTRLFARGYTTLRPSFQFTAWTRDLVQTSVLVATQKGLNPAKAAAMIMKRTAAMNKNGYFHAMYRFSAANALERERLANDPKFLAIEGMDTVVERWRNGGFITFADQLDPKTGERFHIVPRGIREKLAGTGLARMAISMEHISTVLDNIHRQVAYDLMRESGASPAEAALYSRQIMDFNRSSQRGRMLNAFWVFAQSGMTGVNTFLTNHIWKNGAPPMKAINEGGRIKLVLDETRVLQELNKGAVGAFIISGAASTTLAAMLMGHDDDGEPVAKSIQPGTWLNYHILPINYGFLKEAGIEVPIKLPRQYGLQQIFEGIGSLLALKAMGLADDSELAFAATTHLAANLLPVGRLTFPQSLESGGAFDTGTFLKQMIVNYVPTALQAGAQVILNQSTYGSQVHMDPSHNKGKTRVFEDQFIGTPTIYSDISKFLYDSMGLSVYPETIETLVRDQIPILGPIIADVNRTFVNVMSRPERTWLESTLGSSLTPLPGVAYDIKYKDIRLENKINVRYLRPARVEMMNIRSMGDRERATALRQFYKRYPWYRAITSMRSKYGKRMKNIKKRVLEYRRTGQFEKAEATWKEYNTLRRERLGKTIDMFKAYGITDF